MIWLFIAISGAIAVIMGALGAHALIGVIDAKDIERVVTASTYQMYHTILLAVLASFEYRLNNARASIWIFSIAIVLFSGSLYLFAFTQITLFSYVTPVGGLLFILGWLSLVRLKNRF